MNAENTKNQSPVHGHNPYRETWDYEAAFSRNLGLVSSEEQKILSKSHVAIAGLGGVGGVHLVTLARLGVGRFTISDFDTFDIANTNRQYGAFASTAGKSKIDVMTQIVRDINPEVQVRAVSEPIRRGEVDSFLGDADLFVDGIDAFVIDIRRELFQKSREKGIYAISAGPFGFSTGWIVFSPKGMSFEDYMRFDDSADEVDQFLTFALGMAPSGLHIRTMDLNYLDPARHRGPSLGLACQLASGVAAAEALKILLKRGRIRSAPWYQQFDPYGSRYRCQKLWLGNAHPVQRIKKYFALRRVRKLMEGK